MRRTIARMTVAAAVVATAAVGVAAPAGAHGGGHRGGCAGFGHVNRLIAQDPGSFGFPWARNLGELVSTFATSEDGHPGVAEIVEEVDHAACES